MRHYLDVIEKHKKLTQDFAEMIEKHVNAPARKERRAVARPPAEPGALTPEDLAEAWNEVCMPLGLPSVREVSGSRRQKVLSRIREHPKAEFWEECYKAIRSSAFLQGKVNGYKNGHHTWKASFDWLFSNDVNPVKVVEGRYNG